MGLGLGFGFGFGFGSGLGLGLEQVGYAVLAAHAAQPLAGVGLARREQRAQLAGAELGRRASCDCRRCSRQDVAVTNLVAARPQVRPDRGVAAVDGRPLRLAARLVRVRVRARVRARARARARARDRIRVRVRVRVRITECSPSCWGCG